MSNVKEYKDIVAFHPGYYIADIIEDMQISQAEFAARMGTSVDVWQNLQNTYDQKLIEIQQARDFDEQAEIVKQIDYKYFVEVVGLPSTRKTREKAANLCKFLRWQI